MQLVHDMWCHPGNDKMEQIYKARRGRGFPRGFITQLRKFHCSTCAVSKRTRCYRRSTHVKVAAAKRVTQTRTLRTRKPSADVVLNDSKNAEHAGAQEAQKQDFWYGYQTVDVPRMSAFFRERTRTSKSFERFIPISQLFQLSAGDS
jgi:hypothetical protein